MSRKVPESCSWFDINQKLDLIPQLNPPEPWAYGLYPPPTPSQLDNLAIHPSGFDPNADVDKKTTARVKIIKRLSNGLEHGHQVLLCKIEKYPQSLAQPQMPFPRLNPELKSLGTLSENAISYIILKVSDGFLHPSGLGVPPYDNWELAAHFHVRESAALRLHYEKHLVRGNIMGPPYHVPSYYGTWIVKLPYRDSQDGVQKVRYVGAIATEYIRGLSIQNLCESPDPETDRLVPMMSNVFLRHEDPGSDLGSLTPNVEDFRLDVLKLWLEGVVKSLHVGVQFHNLGPQNILVTQLDLDGSSTPTRVVFSDYSRSEIYEKTQLARDPAWPSQHPLTQLPNPVHPFERFCIHSVSILLEWVPREWEDRAWLFDYWLGETFGKVEDSAEHSVFRGVATERHLRTRDLRKIVADIAAGAQVAGRPSIRMWLLEPLGRRILPRLEDWASLQQWNMNNLVNPADRRAMFDE
ncbi:hypothetical protein CKAH01_04810 [Colletotrichum kahawae]|uniref:Protein kinase domain-containing protein n=1 Tax=Colletotrichum kahawae TaxID=34407 RepID=A0AAE0D7X7_COLKA|nr:hypothetical protein CKAH01_04810 [Colletotrichum kahawae]